MSGLNLASATVTVEKSPVTLTISAALIFFRLDKWLHRVLGELYPVSQQYRQDWEARNRKEKVAQLQRGFKATACRCSPVTRVRWRGLGTRTFYCWAGESRVK